MEKPKLFLFLVLALSFIGIVDSLHLLEIKYKGGEFIACDLNEKFSCSSVNMSPQSAVKGFPTAGIGLLGYSLLGFMSVALLFKEDLREKVLFKILLDGVVTPFTLMLVAGAGLAIQLYFTHAEFFILGQFCVFCLFSQLLILGIAVFAFLNYRRELD